MWRMECSEQASEIGVSLAPAAFDAPAADMHVLSVPASQGSSEPVSARSFASSSRAWRGSKWQTLGEWYGAHSDWFWKHVRRYRSGCWRWMRSKNDLGYGYLRLPGSGRMVRAHRLAYAIVYGPIPYGHVLDHTCRVPACCNPDHLEPVTDAENIRRGVAARDTGHCKRGHPRPNNTVWFNSSGRRSYRCVQCRSIREKSLREARAALEIM